MFEEKKRPLRCSGVGVFMLLQFVSQKLKIKNEKDGVSFIDSDSSPRSWWMDGGRGTIKIEKWKVMILFF